MELSFGRAPRRPDRCRHLAVRAGCGTRAAAAAACAHPGALQRQSRRLARGATHAVGDAAIDLVLDAYEKANAEQSIAGKRWSIEPGKLADLVVLNEDPLTCLEPRLRDAQVMMTIVGGKTVFER